jgi:hypothetical protein
MTLQPKTPPKTKKSTASIKIMRFTMGFSSRGLQNQSFAFS